MEILAYQYVAFLYEKALAAEKVNRGCGVRLSGAQGQVCNQSRLSSAPSSSGDGTVWIQPQPPKRWVRRLIKGSRPWLSLIMLLILTLGLAQNAWAALSRGSRGPAVTSLQLNLRSAGYNPGSIDGFFGNTTEYAVRQFQRDRGLPIDGVVGPATEAALTRTGRPRPGSGSSGSSSRTRELQRLLARRGCYRGPIDGVYGPGTRAAVQRAQRAYGLAVDGVAGSATLSALRNSRCSC